MSKIICDLCGSAYNDTEEQCPICGTEKPETADFVTDYFPESNGSNKTYIHERGGRFSKSNVSKRLQSNGAQKPIHKSTKIKKREEKSIKTLALVCLILFVLILFMLGFIYLRYFRPNSSGQTTQTNPSSSQNTKPPEETETEPDSTAVEDIPCTDVKLSETTIRLNKAGNGWLLNVIPVPANTTDSITFTSSDTDVATVSAEGNVVAVSAGEAVITVTCGNVAVECKVVCDIAPPTVETTEPPPETTEPPVMVEFKFNTPFEKEVTHLQEVTLSRKGEMWEAYRGTIALTNIKWSVGNPSVAVVSDKGWVTAVGPGKTTLYAEIDGVTYSCLIRCSFD